MQKSQKRVIFDDFFFSKLMLPHHPTAGRPRDAVFMHIAHIPTITLGRAAAAQSFQEFLVPLQRGGNP